MAMRDLALTVLELEAGEFHWIVMEAVQAESEDCLGYKPVDSSTRGYRDYSEALVQGAIAVRAAQGLASFDLGFHPEGIVAVARQTEPGSATELARVRHTAPGSAPGREASRPAAPWRSAPQALPPSQRPARPASATALPGEFSRTDYAGAPASCMLTTVQSLL